MSSHREAPTISKDPVADNTDLYAFVDPVDTSKVTILSNFIPLEEPLEPRLMDRCPAYLHEGQALRIDIDAERVETAIGEGDGRAESDVPQADERYGHPAPVQRTISGRASGEIVLDLHRTTDALLWSLVPQTSRRLGP